MKPLSPTSARLALLFLAAASMTGCVRRQLTITSEPSGALVYLNSQEAGRTPLTTDITWYGMYDVVLRKDGYDALHKRAKVYSPWWGWPPFDFFAELMPFHPTDVHTFNYTMQPTADTNSATLMQRALELKKQMPTTAPTTNP